MSLVQQQFEECFLEAFKKSLQELNREKEYDDQSKFLLKKHEDNSYHHTFTELSFIMFKRGMDNA